MDNQRRKMSKTNPLYNWNNGEDARLFSALNDILGSTDKWKMSNVCPIHRKKSKNDKSNYRPISLLPILSKIFERIIFESLYNYFTKNNLLVSCQSGFIKGDSCVSQLLSITHSIHENLDANPSLDTKGIFLDMSKAFDKVWHEGLIYKLRSYGVQSNLINLLNDYLNNMRHMVIINGTLARPGNLLNLMYHKAQYWVPFYF